MSQFAVSVIVVNYNCYATLKNCIGSILLSKSVRELILVDNASTDRSMNLVTYSDPRLKIIRLTQNIGLAAARNLGAAKTSSSYLAFTDADVVVHPNWLQNPCAILATHDKIGAVQCNIVRRKNLDKVFQEMAKLNNYNQKRRENSASFNHILYSDGAGFVTRREVWDVVGGFDPAFFVGNDDVDFGLRIWLSGYEVVRSSEGTVFHKFGTLRSKREIAPIFKFYGLRNALSIWIKNLEAKTLVKHVIPFSLLFPFMALWIGGIIGIQGLLSFLRNLPSILVKRHRVQKFRKISDDKIIPMMINKLPIQMFTIDFQVFYRYIIRRIKTKASHAHTRLRALEGLFETLKSTRNFWITPFLSETKRKPVIFRDSSVFWLTKHQYWKVRNIKLAGFNVEQVGYDLFKTSNEDITLIGSSDLLRTVCELLLGFYDWNYHGKVVLDVGGFQGESAVYFSKKGAKKVIIYEPVEAHHKLINRNILANYVNCELHKEGVGLKDGVVTVRFEETDVGFGRKSHGSHEMSIKIRNLSDVIEQSHADIAKFNCEGAEESLVGLPPKVLRKIKVYMVMAHTRKTSKMIIATFKQAGFDIVRKNKQQSFICFRRRGAA